MVQGAGGEDASPVSWIRDEDRNARPDVLDEGGRTLVAERVVDGPAGAASRSNMGGVAGSLD